MQQVAKIKAVLDRCSFQATLARIANDCRCAALQDRALTAEEIDRLKKQGNAAEDWTRVRVHPQFKPDKVIGSHLRGQVRLGKFEEHLTLEHGFTQGSGVYRADLQDCWIGDNVLINNVNLLARTILLTRAALVGCGMVVGGAGNQRYPFGIGRASSLGIETDGREVYFYPDLDLTTASVLSGATFDKNERQALEGVVVQYRERLKYSGSMALDASLQHVPSEVLYTIVDRDVRLLQTPLVVNCYLGPHARIVNAQELRSSCLVSSAEEPVGVTAGAILRNAVLQYGVEVDGSAIVEDSLLAEYSHVGSHAKVTASYLGPNSSVTAGECTHSLVGPFVGFHHQALLIAAWWPAGKGNIGYGANVGSNHTGKAPDQELQIGEGVFFGLGCSIKYPADFMEAPYTILATGIVTQPQKFALPFSLVNLPSRRNPELNASLNECFPGWVLSECSYLLWRNEIKFASRNRARRERISSEVLRPDIVVKLSAALEALQQLPDKDIYTDADLPVLGKNYMTLSARKNGIAAYERYLSFYALRECYYREAQKVAAVEDIVSNTDPVQTGSMAAFDERWQVASTILKKLFLNHDRNQLLKAYLEAQKLCLDDLLRSKTRDFERGSRIIEGYGQTHAQPEDDRIVLHVAKVFEGESRRIAQWLGE